MKKLLSILTAVALTFASCAHFDDPETMKYAAGPTVEIQVTNVTDNAFTVSIIPAVETSFYAYLVDESAVIEELDSYTLLKKQYSGTSVVSSETDSAYTFVYDGAKPFTDYVIYAVAANDKGITGDVVAYQVKTSDGDAPAFREFEENGDGTVAVAFSEGVTRGEGAVKAFYLAEWSLEETEVPAEDITVTIDGSTVNVSVANVPAGAYLFVSWEDGAFLDSKGNACAAYESGVNWETGDLIGVYSHVANVPFDIADEYVSPDGDKIKNWEEEQISVEFPFAIYRNDEELTGLEIHVTYISEDKTTVYDIANDAWEVADSTLSITLPAEPAIGDVIGFSIGAESIFDEYGNPNNEYTLEEGWVYDNSSWSPAYVGTFTYTTFFGSADEPEMDEGLILYSSDEEEGVWKIENVFYGVDFVFTLDSDNKITWDPQFSGYHYDYYDSDVYVIDRWWWTEGAVDQGYYAGGVFYFPTYYYMQGIGGLYSGYETFTLTGYPEAKARQAVAKKTLTATSVKFTKDTLVKSLSK